MHVLHVRPNCSPKVTEQIGFKDFSWKHVQRLHCIRTALYSIGYQTWVQKGFLLLVIICKRQTKI